MNDFTLIVSLVTLGGVIVGVVVNISGMVSKREQKAAADARIEVKLDNIYLKVDCIEKRQSSTEVQLQQHDVRITKVEESTKSAHHRIDEIDDRKK
jgi:hypothetical protein